MRAFGPGSISSFLKTVLDLLYALLWVTAALLLSAAVGAALAQPFLNGPGSAGRAPSELEALLRRGPALAAAFVVGGVNVAGLIVIAQRLRRVFATMTAGDPFEPGNVGRLQTIGTALLILQPAGFVLGLALARLWPAPGRARGGLALDVSAWFAVLIVFVLAEVFREGARLRTETRLTV